MRAPGITFQHLYRTRTGPAPPRIGVVNSATDGLDMSVTQRPFLASDGRSLRQKSLEFVPCHAVPFAKRFRLHVVVRTPDNLT